MRFVIIGAGSVGLRTARVLRDSGHTVVVVEKDDEVLKRLGDEGFDTVRNTGPLAEVLERADVEAADAVGALTDDLNTNFAACMIAKQAGCRTVMRLDEAYGEEVYRQYASDVDEIIHPERLGSVVVTNALSGGNIRAIADIKQSLQIVEFTVTESSPMGGYSLSELELPSDARLLAYGKGDGPLDLPTADEVLDVGDQLVVLTDFRKLGDVRRLIVGEDGPQVLAT
ncbi:MULTISPECIES: potassium channel family protein [Salinibaculum]|uniref:potassium channel family protein n=1 Tax=Salinibaculum TaxID=2732368 RepID=UPI0030D610BE